MGSKELPPGAKVLVTGANGYIAMWIIHYLLEEGYFVRGAVRTESKAEDIHKHFREATKGNKLEMVIVEDIEQKGAFDKAVEDMDVVIHTASPVKFIDGHPDELIKPAVGATVGLLQSCLNKGRVLKRVVLTSTTGTIIRMAETKTTVYTEDNWNNACLEIIARLGKDAAGMDKYHASKVLAEKAAWDFVKQHEGEIDWDICTIHPSWVFGPFLNDWNDLNSLNASLKFWHNVVLGPTPSSKETLETSGGSVDVRDVALAHILAMQKPEAGGERFLLSAYDFVWHDMIECANACAPPALIKSVIPLQPNIEKRYIKQYNNSKARRILGITFRSKEEMVVDLLEQFVDKGIVNANV